MDSFGKSKKLEISHMKWQLHFDMVGLCVSPYFMPPQAQTLYPDSMCVVVQTGPSNLSIDNFATSTHQDLKTDIQIKGTYTTGENVAIWNGRKLVVYEITGDKSTIRAAGTFSTESTICCLYEQNVYTIEQGKVQVRTFQGTVKQLISFTEVEGQPVTLEVCSVGTENGIIKLYDLSRREAKQIGTAKNMTDVISHFGGFVSLRCNCAGNKVSLCIKKPNGSTDSKLYIWDTELDTLQYFNFETGKGEQDDFAPGTMESDQETAEERGKNQAARDIAGRFPISHFWDPLETKLLVCETKSLPNQQSKLNQSISLTSSMSRATLEQPPEMMIVSLFVTPENGVLIQDSFSMKKSHSSMLGMQVPYYYFARKAEDTDKADANAALDESMNRPQTTAAPSFTSKAVSRRTMRDFIGLEDADKNARDAMMNFSFYLTIGNMDEAFKAIKLIRSESVWENMAKMCVKTRRLDVATVCLGNMGHARGAKALRESVAEPELDARVACLAVQLDLHEDAVRPLKNCKRYDLLNDFYQSNGQWGKAMETAEMYDRVHLRTTYYNYGKHLETKGDVNGAIPNYEKSETHRFEVPRMLFDDTQMLENYIVKNKDKQLRKWWAQYMESAGEMETALQFYEAAADYLSLVRVYCYCGNLDKAAEICNETGDRAACYHLARQYENNNEIKQAIHFFTRAQAYGNAIRLCKENEYEDQLMNLALVSSPVHMIEAARYYENKHDGMDKAVMLYHKGGNFAKALDLAFQSRQLGALQHIAEDLTDTTDPELLQRCADFFMENGQFDKAVDLLAVGKKYIEALKLCHQHQVPMTEELVEKLTPAKGVAENETDERNKILEGIAEVCMNQRQYHLATKKFTQAGNKMKAMKSLLKSGDTEKIIFFAGVSRQKEIYVMAANYLQSLDWRKDPEIMKNIIGFYTKGRALDSLSGFYDACAMVEVDEYQNYDKALGALTEAYKCLTKAKMKNQTQQEEKLAALKTRITLMKKFVTARRAYDEDKDEAVKACQVLLEEPELDSAVRVGDVFGFMIEHYAKKEHWKAAYACMEEMRAKIPKVNLGYYVNMRTIEQVHSALQIPLGRGTGAEINGFQAGSPGDEETGEEVEEDVIDDFADD
ncbi:unnamed protein product [Owenia fusiformis]|uniref:Intraflagellar transport protein 140 n=1 Tax=Owenia fusiformis TaxID=6347 RepID=A0A8S4PKI1_OWEFU|nr:unnamed protein product [Owenia fusiformis]